MRINKVLDLVFARKSNIGVLRVLKNYTTGISGREVGRLAGLAAKNSIITLTHLEDLGLVKNIKGGREHLFSLNRESFLVRNSILPLLESERDFEKSLKKEIRTKLKLVVVSAIIFGSVARKEETIESDLDLCVIFESKAMLQKAEKAIGDLMTILYKKYGVNLSPIYIRKSEFKKKAEADQSPVKQIIEEGEVITGESPVNRITNAKRS